ncbi:PqqD family protein [uncultured Clostridium sp.]|uniref:PqqD family protein n=1 Tax=uncultured Clostridium sp. TaxID=59620 RepID=UPI002583B57D|nr:PqqD family protein [uncultured Clostridium sp.]MDU1347899.1 PqqD family protein [Clostridium argentinense]
MKYEVNKDMIKIRDEQDETVSAILNETKQIIYLNKTAAIILKKYGQIKDTYTLVKYVIKEFELENKEEKQIEDDLIDALYQLEALGIVKLLDKKEIKESLKIAGERDYSNIAIFIIDNIDNDYAYASVNNKKYYNPVSIRGRQFNNVEYNITKYKNNEIIGNMVIMPPANGSMFTVMSINSIIFKESLSENEIFSVLKEMVEFVQKNFSNDYNKVRFFYFYEKQQKIKNMLLRLGFEKICVYEKEINKEKDLEVFDRYINEVE